MGRKEKIPAHGCSAVREDYRQTPKGRDSGRRQQMNIHRPQEDGARNGTHMVMTYLSQIEDRAKTLSPTKL